MWLRRRCTRPAAGPSAIHLAENRIGPRMNRAPADHGDSDGPVEALTSAWLSYPPAPDLAAFIADGVRSDEQRLLDLVRVDVQNRVHRGEPVRLEDYARAISPAAVAPGTPLARLVLGFERLAGASAEKVRARLGDAYAADIDAVFSREEPMPPTGVGEADPDHDPDPEPSSHGTERARGWAKGDQIGPYKLRKRLGSGGFGEVWLASRRSPDLDVAIKVLKPGVTDEDSVRRFEVEAQALAFLEHQYVAKIHDAGTVRGLPYIAMEYVEGKPLTRYCDDRRLSFEQRLELMVRVCEGVQHAHQRGLIHRDLKPDNILVTEIVRHPKEVDEHERLLVVDQTDGKVIVAVPKVVDFGLAKAAEKTVRLTDGTLTVDLGKMMGTPEYMAPEQAGHQPHEVTQKADIFALGVILYELLSGTLPLTREELRNRAVEELVAMLRGTPRPEPSTRFGRLDEQSVNDVSYHRGEMTAKELGSRLRSRARHLCGKALRLEPDKRFSSAAMLGLDIRNYLEDKDFEEAAAEPRRDRILRNLRRHKLPYAAAASVFLALVAGIAGTTWQWQRAKDATIEANTQSYQATLEQSLALLSARRPLEARHVLDTIAPQDSKRPFPTNTIEFVTRWMSHYLAPEPILRVTTPASIRSFASAANSTDLFILLEDGRVAIVDVVAGCARFIPTKPTLKSATTESFYTVEHDIHWFFPNGAKSGLPLRFRNSPTEMMSLDASAIYELGESNTDEHDGVSIRLRSTHMAASSDWSPTNLGLGHTVYNGVTVLGDDSGALVYSGGTSNGSAYPYTIIANICRGPIRSFNCIPLEEDGIKGRINAAIPGRPASPTVLLAMGYESQPRSGVSLVEVAVHNDTISTRTLCDDFDGGIPVRVAISSAESCYVLTNDGIIHMVDLATGARTSSPLMSGIILDDRVDGSQLSASCPEMGWAAIATGPSTIDILGKHLVRPRLEVISTGPLFPGDDLVHAFGGRWIGIHRYRDVGPHNAIHFPTGIATSPDAMMDERGGNAAYEMLDILPASVVGATDRRMLLLESVLPGIAQSSALSPDGLTRLSVSDGNTLRSTAPSDTWIADFDPRGLTGPPAIGVTENLPAASTGELPLSHQQFYRLCLAGSGELARAFVDRYGLPSYSGAAEDYVRVLLEGGLQRDALSVLRSIQRGAIPSRMTQEELLVLVRSVEDKLAGDD
jgi:serine/threonine protein kinase